MYRGFSLILPAGMKADELYVLIKREGTYRVDMGDTEKGNLTRLDNFMDRELNKRVGELQIQMDLLRKEQAQIEVELASEAIYAEKIEEYSRKLDKIDKELGVKE